MEIQIYYQTKKNHSQSGFWNFNNRADEKGLDFLEPEDFEYRDSMNN